MIVDCRRWQVVCGPEKQQRHQSVCCERGSSDNGSSSRCRESNIKTRESAAKSRLGGDPLWGVFAGDRHLGLREPCTFHGGCGQSGLGLALYTCLVKARWAAGSDDRGARDTTLPTRQRGKTTPSLESWGVRHGGQAGVNRQAPWRGFEGNLEVRDRNHRGMGARILECRWQTLTECILTLTERG